MSRTQAQEDYLKVIYKLNEQQDAKLRASNNQIAELLQVSPASVTSMLKNLKDKNLITQEPYHGAFLTKSGLSIALQMVRRHRIIETYLVEKLKYSWDEVDVEAEILEHFVSDIMIDRMWEALDMPQYDPHGSPIPTKRGRIPKKVIKLLPDLKVNDEVRVIRIKNKSPAELRYFAQLGLQVGTPIKILDKKMFKGPISIQVNGHEHMIDYQLSQAVLVSLKKL